MQFTFDPGHLLQEARARAGLNQRELAQRAATSQSVISRIEQGKTSPTFDTFVRLMHAAGMEAWAGLEPLPPSDSHMMNDVARILSLTPEQRLLEIHNISRFEAAARRV